MPPWRIVAKYTVGFPGGVELRRSSRHSDQFIYSPFSFHSVFAFVEQSEVVGND